MYNGGALITGHKKTERRPRNERVKRTFHSAPVSVPRLYHNFLFITDVLTTILKAISVRKRVTVYVSYFVISIFRRLLN